MAALVRVWVDGVERRGVVSFDTRNGECECYEYEEGSSIPRVKDGNLVTIKLTGKVEAVGAVG